MASIWKHLQVAIVGKHNDLGQGEKEKLEVTDLSDTSRRYINGLADTPDSWEFEFQYQSASDSAFYLLKTAMDDGEVHQFAKFMAF